MAKNSKGKKVPKEVKSKAKKIFKGMESLKHDLIDIAETIIPKDNMATVRNDMKTRAKKFGLKFDKRFMKAVHLGWTMRDKIQESWNELDKPAHFKLEMETILLILSEK